MMTPLLYDSRARRFWGGALHAARGAHPPARHHSLPPLQKTKLKPKNKTTKKRPRRPGLPRVQHHLDARRRQRRRPGVVPRRRARRRRRDAAHAQRHARALSIIRLFSPLIAPWRDAQQHTAHSTHIFPTKSEKCTLGVPSQPAVSRLPLPAAHTLTA